MKKIVLTFGLISGFIIVAMFVVTLPLTMNGTIDFDNSAVIGYSTMVLSFLLVFFGIRSYRENVNGGTVTFGRAFKVGLLITLVACGIYVTTWEIYFWGFNPNFGDQYAERMIEMMREKGETAERIAAEQQKMAQFKDLYRNPLFNIGMTFLEIFPVGLIMTLVSAAILRKPAPNSPPIEALA